jgi:hypothetical protein
LRKEIPQHINLRRILADEIPGGLRRIHDALNTASHLA